MKYIMLECQLRDGVTKLVPIIFPDFMCHSDISSAVEIILSQTHKFDVKVFSAGDISISAHTCTGMSETLRVQSSPLDREVIDTYDYLHGIVGQ